MHKDKQPNAPARRAKLFRACVSLLAAAGMLVGAAPSMALEPGNNSVPLATSSADIYGDMEVMVTAGPSAATQANVSSTTDVDHLLLVCSGTRRVSQVRLMFLSADIDLQVLTTEASRAVLGSSVASGSQNELVTVPATHRAVIAKVYGFSGAISSYNIGLTCT